MTKPDRLLTSKEAAEVVGVKPATWLSLVSQGYAPKPDDPDEGRPVNRRTPRWLESSVETFKANRPGRGAPGRPRRARQPKARVIKQMSQTMNEVRRISAQLGEVTGTEPFAYMSEPSPGSYTVVFQSEVIAGRDRTTVEGRALAYVQGIAAQVAAGTWDNFTCRVCPQAFTSAGDKAIHEASHGRRAR